MNETIYDFRPLPLLSADLPSKRSHGSRAPAGSQASAIGRVGVITNPRSRRHQSGDRTLRFSPDVLAAAPATRAELRDVLASFARQQIDLLVIDGGDGTIRDVLTCAGSAWGENWPRIAVLPSGKTNALAIDLGVPADWSLEDALAAARLGRIVQRAPIEIEQPDVPGPAVRGFLFGAGAFVSATELAQRTHRAGAFDGVAVALAIGWGITRTLFGGGRSAWRRGSRMTLDFGDNSEGLNGPLPRADARRYIMVASTLQRLPAGLKPFGRLRPGLKALIVDAPARRLAATLPYILAGWESPALAGRGYHRVRADRIAVELDSSFILDGEMFPQGRYVLRRASPLRFVVP